MGGAVVRAPVSGIRVELGDPQGGAATEETDELRHRLCLRSASRLALARSSVGWDSIYSLVPHPPSRKAEALPRSPEGWVETGRKQLL